MPAANLKIKHVRRAGLATSVSYKYHGARWQEIVSKALFPCIFFFFKHMRTILWVKKQMNFIVLWPSTLTHVFTCCMLHCGLIARRLWVQVWPCGLSVSSLHVLPASAWVLFKPSGFLQQPNNMHVKWIQNHIYNVAVCLCEQKRAHACSSVYVV